MQFYTEVANRRRIGLELFFLISVEVALSNDPNLQYIVMSLECGFI